MDAVVYWLTIADSCQDNQRDCRFVIKQKTNPKGNSILRGRASPIKASPVSVLISCIISHRHASYRLSVWAPRPLWLRNLAFGLCGHQERMYCRRSGCYFNSCSVHPCRCAVYQPRLPQVGFRFFWWFCRNLPWGWQWRLKWLVCLRLQQFWPSCRFSCHITACDRALTFLK